MKAKTILLAGGALALAVLAVVLVADLSGADSVEPAVEPGEAIAPTEPAAPQRQAAPARHTSVPRPGRPPAPVAAEAAQPQQAEHPAEPGSRPPRAPVPPNRDLTLPIDKRREKLGKQALQQQTQLYRDRIAVLKEQIRSQSAAIQRMERSGRASREGLAQAQRRLQQMIDAEPRIREHLKQLEQRLKGSK